jgi:hypothetical protein
MGGLVALHGDDGREDQIKRREDQLFHFIVYTPIPINTRGATTTDKKETERFSLVPFLMKIL